MIPLVGVAQALMNWSVERKMLIMLFSMTVLMPLVVLLVLQAKGEQVTLNFLVVLTTGTIILLVPMAKWVSHAVALRNIKELNVQCQKLKRGDYAHVALADGELDGEGHDFLQLKRNMHWMGYAIASREQRLKSAMTDLSKAQRQIQESIEYASVIQTAFLPDTVRLAESLPKHFLIWEQRDKVGGDSYWFKPWDKGFFVGVIDCTGHGVPGAFMTLIVHSLLDKAIAEGGFSPAAVLGSMNRLIKDALHQNTADSISDDGMDCALCFVDIVNAKLVFAGANLPLYINDFEGGRVIKGDRCGLGYVRSPRNFKFADVEMPLTSRACFYLATDGLIDQAGGEKGFPFGRRRFMQFIQDNDQRPIADQGERLMRVLADYQGGETRRDDMTVLGFEVR